MINTFVPPKPGERIHLMCVKCRKIFIGPNPGYNSPYRVFGIKVKKAVCPKCGSKRIIPYPGVCY